MSTYYQKISCADHSTYELVIMRGQSIRVVINKESQIIKPLDIVTKSDAEFLIFLDENNTKQELRADKVIIEK